MSLKLSICIATHERSHLLQRALESIARQDRLPDEIVISDSSSTDASWQVVKAFTQAHPNLSIKFCKSDRKALPWQRWFAFSNSNGDLVFFLDDDIRLDRTACARIIQTFLFPSEGTKKIVGIGLITTYENGIPSVRLEHSWHECWLGTSQYPSGAITPGGLTVTHAGLALNTLHSVQWLWGASMAYSREVLNAIGPLKGLYHIYDIGIGKGEDGVLSFQARRYGELVLLTDPLAFHPPLENAIRTANVHSGWLLGLRETIGRAHIMLWMAQDVRQAQREWGRFAMRELLLAARQVASRPYIRSPWQHLIAAIFGIVWCARNWDRIPRTPAEDLYALNIPKLFWQGSH